MEKINKIFIGSLNLLNFNQLKNIKSKSNEKHIVIFFNIDINKLNINNLSYIKENTYNIHLINNGLKINKSKLKDPEYTLYIDWLLGLPSELKYILNNGASFLITYRDALWHRQYDGSQGYAITTHKEEKDTIYYKFSASINENAEKLIQKEFDGFFLKNTE